jgi:hypothetical protein
MPQASILEIERPPLDRPHRPLSRPQIAGERGTGERERSANAATPVIGPGRLYLIERGGGDLDLTSAEREALAGANIIVYERSLASLVAAILPLGAYAEPGPEPSTPVFARCLKFALDGWSVVQLMERRPPAERARWVEDAAEQLASAGVSSDTPVQMLVDAACGGPADIATQLRSVHVVLEDRGLAHGLDMGGLIMVLGPIAKGPAPQIYAFAANGLAG